METVYLVLMFLGPGLAINVYNRQVRIVGEQRNRPGTIYEQLFGICAHSTIITTMTLLAIMWLHKALGATFPTTLSGVLENLNDLSQLGAYAITCGVMTIIWYQIYSKGLVSILFRAYKLKMKKEKGLVIKNREFPTVWENIFLTREGNEMRKVVSIFKDGNYVTSGELAGWNAGADEKRELRIYNSHIIEQVLNDDKDKDDVSERLLYNVEFEYYDVDSSTLIRFYDTEKLDKHWDEL